MSTAFDEVNAVRLGGTKQGCLESDGEVCPPFFCSFSRATFGFLTEVRGDVAAASFACAAVARGA